MEIENVFVIGGLIGGRDLHVEAGSDAVERLAKEERSKAAAFGGGDRRAKRDHFDCERAVANDFEGGL